MAQKKEILKAESKNFNFHYADGTHAVSGKNYFMIKIILKAIRRHYQIL